MSRREITTLAGAALLVIGAFLPVLSLPIAGSINYFSNGHGDGTIVIVLALGAAVTGFLRASWFPALLGLIAAYVIGYDFFNAIRHISEMKTGMTADLKGNPFAGLATAMAESVQLQWGWAVLALGALILMASALIADAPARNLPTPLTHVVCPDCAELVRREARVCRYCGCRLTPQ